jgi:hypothetical protein
MPRDWIPSKDAELLAFSSQFATKIAADPEDWSLTAANATALTAAQTAYATKYAAAVNPQTRGRSTCFAKDEAKKSLVALMRQVARQIQGSMTVTNQQREDIGLPVHDVEPTPVGVPGQCAVEIVSVVGRTAKVRIFDPANSTRRGRPPGVAGMTVVSYVGDQKSENPADYTLQGVTSKSIIDVTFPASVPAGATVWISAYYFNAKCQAGAAAVPQSTNLQGGSLQAA